MLINRGPVVSDTSLFSSDLVTNTGITLGYLTSLLAYTFSVNITPGPNNIMLTASGINFGYKKSLPHLLGITTGSFILFSSVALGLGSVFKAFPFLHTALKIIGSAYLLWLAYKIFTAKGDKFSSDRARPLTYFQALAFQAVNPKAWTMSITAVSAFSLMGDLLWVSLIAIVIMQTVMVFPCCSVWTLIGVKIKQFIQTPKNLLMFNRVLGALTASCVIMIFS